MLMVMLNGPLVVSPPTKLNLYSLASSLREAEKSPSHCSSILGRVKAKVKYFGVAPMAARSLKLTARALYAMSCALVSEEKCTPSSNVSTLLNN